ncbi:hypothetical protein GCM10010524_03100 [Streptomyces mexicanus]
MLVGARGAGSVGPVLGAVPAVALVAALAGGQLLLLVARRRGRGRRSGRAGLAHGAVDGDRDTDRPAALPGQGLADDRGEAAFEHALGELVRHGEQRGVRDQRQRLAAADPVFVLRLDALSAALPEELLQYSRPHCGKIGGYVSHRARSLTGPTNVWFGTGRDVNGGQGNEWESSHGSQRGGYGSSCCPQAVDKCAAPRAGLTGRRNRAYRNQVELSMAAAACLRRAQITSR